MSGWKVWYLYGTDVISVESITSGVGSSRVRVHLSAGSFVRVYGAAEPNPNLNHDPNLNPNLRNAL